MRHVATLNFVPAVFLAIAPFVLNANRAVMLNDVTCAVILAVCSLAIMRASHPLLFDAASIVVGIWLIVSPFLLAYPPARSGGDVLAGMLVLFVSSMEMLEDTHHGLA